MIVLLLLTVVKVNLRKFFLVLAENVDHLLLFPRSL